mgnify:CR=1 FL=1
MRRSYIQIDGVLYEKGTEPQRESQGPMVMGDIKPYRSMIDGSEITSRSKHREHLRAHGCIEIGNETKYLQPKPLQSPPGLKETIIRATEQVLSKRR